MEDSLFTITQMVVVFTQKTNKKKKKPIKKYYFTNNFILFELSFKTIYIILQYNCNNKHNFILNFYYYYYYYCGKWKSPHPNLKPKK